MYLQVVLRRLKIAFFCHFFFPQKNIAGRSNFFNVPIFKGWVPSKKQVSHGPFLKGLDL